MQGTLQTTRHHEENTEMSVTGKVAYVNGDTVVVKISHIDKAFIKYGLTTKAFQTLMPECTDLPESLSARYICFNTNANTFFLPMSPSSKKLFQDIVNCTEVNKARTNTNQDCFQIVNLQKSNIWQCPEPWVGNLDTASIMFLSSNPSIDVNEIYPIISGSNIWGQSDIENFFENRFSATHTISGTQYVKEYRTLLNNGEYSRPVRYWKRIKEYADALQGQTNTTKDEVINLKDIVLTEFVHCKSKKEKGVATALHKCTTHTQNIINRFTGSTICVVGAIAKKNFINIYGKGTSSKAHYIKVTYNKNTYCDTSYSYTINNKIITVIFLPHPNARMKSLIINNITV